MIKDYPNQYLAFVTRGTKVLYRVGVAGDTREEAREMALRGKFKEYGYGVKVFPSHFDRYGKERLDHLNK